MNPGDVVMFSSPLSESEKVERYEVVEDRDSCVLVRYINASMKIAPTYVFCKNELKVCSNEKEH